LWPGLNKLSPGKIKEEIIMKRTNYLFVLFFLLPVWLANYSCNEVPVKKIGAPANEKSVTGYYNTTLSHEGKDLEVGIKLQQDSSALYITDYKNFKPEIVLNGTWRLDENDSSLINITFNDEVMKFRKTGSKLDLEANKGRRIW